MKLKRIENGNTLSQIILFGGIAQTEHKPSKREIKEHSAKQMECVSVFRGEAKQKSRFKVCQKKVSNSEKLGWTDGVLRGEGRGVQRTAGP